MRLLNKKIITVVFAALLISLISISLHSSTNAVACSAVPSSNGTAKATFSLAASGTYQVWAHVYAPAPGGDSLNLAVDGGCSTSISGSKLVKGFNWLSHNVSTRAVTMQLSKGTHVLTIASNSPNLGVDRVLLLTSTSCDPSGSGSNCLAASVVTTTTPIQPTPSQITGVPEQHSTSLALRLFFVAISTIAAAIIAFFQLRFAAHPNSPIKRLPFLKKFSTDNESEASKVVTNGQSVKPLLPSPNRAVMFIFGFAVIGGLVGLIASAATAYGVAIDLSTATVTGPAKIVINARAINGSMVQFGNGPSTSKAKPATGKNTTHNVGKTQTSTPKKSTTGTTVTVPKGSNCTHPSWSSSNPEDTDPIGNNDVWWVNNDAWSGSHGPQSIFVCSQSSWYAVSKQPNVGGQVETYPDTEYDVAGRGNAKKTIAQYNSITSTFSEAYPSAGSWDAAYDLWLNNWSTEIMIWNQWTGTQLYWPSDKSTSVSLGGTAYWFQNLGGEYIFFRKNMVTSGSVNILAALNYLVSKKLVKSTDVPTQLEYGVEICSTSGTETFPMTGLTFSLN